MPRINILTLKDTLKLNDSIMEQKILFNYMPPGLLSMPAAAFSVLGSYLGSKGIGCRVHYWNMEFSKLQCDFLWATDTSVLSDETNSLLLFFNYLSVRMNDKPTYNKIKGKLISIKPQFVGRGEDLFDKHMKRYAELLDKAIDEIIDKTCSPDIPFYGFSANLYQWVCSSIIVAKIKEKYPQSISILGGIGTQNAAIKFLENFGQFDYALWGEGENSLYSLISSLENGEVPLDDIPNLAYRKEDKVITSTNRKVLFTDLSSLDERPDYHDYFKQKKEYEHLTGLETAITVEGSRGCHWNRCHFCYLNVGYKNRAKSVDALLDEIRYHIKEFNVYRFNFLDNDVIDNDYARFDQLLDRLIELRQDYPDFKIGLAEIVTKNINAETIKKMLLAGFERVQIGYESPSDNLLKKIEKKNSFASNLLFIKYATLYNIRVEGANIIIGLLEETDDDIIEGVYNLHALRFYFNNGRFNHQMTRLAISHASRYYKQTKEDSGKWERSRLFAWFLPQPYLKLGDKCLDIVDVYDAQVNSLWDTFVQTESYYQHNRFAYQLVKHENIVLYKESFNDVSINELEFEIDSLDWYILKAGNEKVISYTELLNCIRNDIDKNVLEVEVVNTIEELKGEGLLYATDNYTEIASIINTNNLLV